MSYCYYDYLKKQEEKVEIINKIIEDYNFPQWMAEKIYERAEENLSYEYSAVYDEALSLAEFVKDLKRGVPF